MTDCAWKDPDQTAKADAGKLQLTMCPLEIIEDVAEGIPYMGTGYVKGGRWYHDHGSPVLERVVSWRENRKARLAPHWIPCSERLPEREGRYLCTNSCWGKWAVDINMWTEDGWLYAGNEPIAWMELPEPYGEVEE